MEIVGVICGRMVQMVGMPLMVGGLDARAGLAVGGKWVGETVRRWFDGGCWELMGAVGS